MKLPLVGGAYEARSLIANAQRSVNLYAERNPEDAPFPFTHYPTPGLTVCATPSPAGAARGIYRASNGELYYCVGDKLYLVNSDCTLTLLGTLTGAVVGKILSGTISASGTGYWPVLFPRTFSGIPLAGGSGTGATASLTSSVGQITVVVIENAGSGYAVGDVLGADLGGQIGNDPGDVSITAAGTGYDDGTYINATFETLTGVGQGALGYVVVTGGVVTTFEASGGVGYAVGDTVTLAAYAGPGTGFVGTINTVEDTGSGFQYTLTNVTASTVTTGPVRMADNGLVLVLVDGSTAGYAVDLATHAFGLITDENFLGASHVDYVDTYFVLNVPGTNQWYISLSNVAFKNLTGGGIGSGVINDAGTGILPATGRHVYYGQSLLGGSGEGATADITISGGAVVSVVIADPGVGYVVGDTMGALFSGALNGVSVLNGGAGYTASATNQPVAVASGDGHEGTLDITVAGGAATAVAVNAPGLQYSIGDILNWSDGAGTGAQFKVVGVSYSESAFEYEVNAIVSTGFDALDEAAKVGFPDPLQGLIVCMRKVLLIGTQTSEPWYNTGAADFTFGLDAGSFIEHGTIAPYSLARQDVAVYMLGQDREGTRMVLQIDGGASAKRISTHAIEQALAGYDVVSDATGYTYQQGGHTFYVLSFPTADATWVYDASTQLWHQRAWSDDDGVFHRHRVAFAAAANGAVYGGDWETGVLYQIDPSAYDDAGDPIARVRGFAHLQSDGKRVRHDSFIAEVEVGTAAGTTTDDPAQIWLRWSDDRGQSWSNPVLQSLGSGGQYRTSVQWRRLGMARDRVYELGWSGAYPSALNGADVQGQPLGT